MSDIHPKTPTELVAQIWCEPKNSHTEMNPNLAESMVTLLEREQRHTDAWVDTAAFHCRNEEFYRGICQKVGEILGEAAYTSDDGSKQDNVLALKLPELVRALKESTSAFKANGGF